MTSLEDVYETARLMEGFPHPWCIAGGWALELWAGGVSREHADVEIAVYRETQAALREHLAGAELRRVVLVDGEPQWGPWPEGDYVELPFHQVQARWEGGCPEELDIFLMERKDGLWISRRDPRVVRPEEEIVLRVSDDSLAAGIPVLAPEIQLLYKAKYHREKDDRDFDRVLPLLSERQRSWLREALEITHPGDAWLTRL